MDINDLKKLIVTITNKRNAAFRARTLAGTMGDKSAYDYERGKEAAYLEILDML